MKASLENIITDIEKYCTKNNISHRFVGSVSYGGLLNEKTTYKIDITNKKIHLYHNNPITLIRKDNSIRDIDIILLCNDKKKLIDFKDFLSSLNLNYVKSGKTFPLISIESAIYPDFGKRNKFFQFVYALEVDKKDNLSLTFDDLVQPISWKSIEPWKVYLQSGICFTTRNPIGDYFAYHFRVPSGIRPKDEKKVALLKKLTDEVIGRGKEKKIKYLSDQYFGPWKKFSEALNKTTHPAILFKRELSKYYWHTIGTYLAHGKGTGKLFLAFQNQFTGIKQ